MQHQQQQRQMQHHSLMSGNNGMLGHQGFHPVHHHTQQTINNILNGIPQQANGMQIPYGNPQGFNNNNINNGNGNLTVITGEFLTYFKEIFVYF